jgi:hypothetical protein
MYTNFNNFTHLMTAFKPAFALQEVVTGRMKEGASESSPGKKCRVVWGAPESCHDL